MPKTNSHLHRSCLTSFRVFRLNFASDFFNLLLAGFHQAEIIIPKHLIEGRNNETKLGVEPLIMVVVKMTLQTTAPRCRYLHCTRRSFGHRKIVLQEIYVILAKFAPQGSENRKILGSYPG